MTRLADLARLVRAPAALTVPGDVLAGAAAAGRPLDRRVVAQSAASVCLYWAGMALNDYVDRLLDAEERPERPIPSGAVAPGTALGVAAGLTVAGLGLSALAGGGAVALSLAALVWAYDVALKSTPAGPVAMGAARAANVLTGAVGDLRGALPAAVLVGAHTVSVTRLSRHEVSGAGRAVPASALAVTGAVGVTAGLVRRRPLAALFAAGYLATCGRAQLSAVDDPVAGVVRRAVAAGIHGLIPLQATLIARAGSPAAAPVAAVFPLARWLGRRVSPT
jgi:4-hydroxybenzoate polyprenyltransferase